MEEQAPKKQEAGVEIGRVTESEEVERKNKPRKNQKSK